MTQLAAATAKEGAPDDGHVRFYASAHHYQVSAGCIFFFFIGSSLFLISADLAYTQALIWVSMDKAAQARGAPLPMYPIPQMQGFGPIHHWHLWPMISHFTMHSKSWCFWKMSVKLELAKGSGHPHPIPI